MGPASHTIFGLWQLRCVADRCPGESRGENWKVVRWDRLCLDRQTAARSAIMFETRGVPGDGVWWFASGNGSRSTRYVYPASHLDPLEALR